DVIVADLAGAPGLLAEALDHLGPAREVVAQDLQGDPLLDRDVLGLVDEAHPALADPPEDPVALLEDGADHGVVADARGVPLGRGDEAGAVVRTEDLTPREVGLARRADLHHGASR